MTPFSFMFLLFLTLSGEMAPKRNRQQYAAEINGENKIMPGLALGSPGRPAHHNFDLFQSESPLHLRRKLLYSPLYPVTACPYADFKACLYYLPPRAFAYKAWGNRIRYNCHLPSEPQHFPHYRFNFSKLYSAIQTGHVYHSKTGRAQARATAATLVMSDAPRKVGACLTFHKVSKAMMATQQVILTGFQAAVKVRADSSG